MDSSAVSSALSALSNSQTNDPVGVLMLKKALDAEKQNAAQLVATLPPTPQYNNPPNLGGKVDLFA